MDNGPNAELPSSSALNLDASAGRASLAKRGGPKRRIKARDALGDALERTQGLGDILFKTMKAENGSKQASPASYRTRCFAKVSGRDPLPINEIKDLIMRRNISGSRLFNKFVVGQAPLPRKVVFWLRSRASPGAFAPQFAHAPTHPHALPPPHRALVWYFPAPGLNLSLRRSGCLSLSAMRPQQAEATPGNGAGRESHRRTRAANPNWVHVILAAAVITVVSSVVGIVAYNWFYQSALVTLSSSLQPISRAFHQLGAGHLSQASPSPGD
jgi:hypothetical protein